MKNIFIVKRLSLVMVIILAVFISGCTAEEDPIDKSQVEWDQFNYHAEVFIDYMVNDDFDAAVAMFDRTMAHSISAPGLKAIWDEIIQHAGGFITFYDVDNMVADGYFVCDITSLHEDIGVILRVVFDKNELIAGFFIMDYPKLP